MMPGLCSISSVKASLLAAQPLMAQGQEQAFMAAKVATAQFYAQHILSKVPGLRAAIVHGGDSVMALPMEAF